MSEDNKTAIITGAGSGVGRAVALRLAREGYHLALVARTKQKLDETARLAREQSEIDTLVLPTDLTDAQATRALPGKVIDRWGRLDVIAHVAGYASLQPIEQIDDATWRATIDTNVSYVVNLTAAAWPIFKQQQSGFVANVSSMASIDPFPGFSIYAAAKVAVNMFTQATAKEGADIGLQAVCIAPGAVETPMLRSLFDEDTIPPDQTMSPEHVADALVDCVVGKRDFEPGETIVLQPER